MRILDRVRVFLLAHKTFPDQEEMLPGLIRRLGPGQVDALFRQFVSDAQRRCYWDEWQPAWRFWRALRIVAKL
jgi:hypothetical protein